MLTLNRTSRCNKVDAVRLQVKFTFTEGSEGRVLQFIIYNRFFRITSIITVITRKKRNMRTAFPQYLSVFDVVTKKIVLLVTYEITL